MANKNNFLVISDCHIPYEHHGALKFLKDLQKEYDIPHENIYSVGDLLDLYNFSRYPKSPNAPDSAVKEIEHARATIKKWAQAFPEMKMCHSNHDQRIWRKATESELPSQVIRSIEEIFDFPKSWQLKDMFIVCGTRGEFLIEHGEGFSGINGARDAAIANGIPTIIGHLHANAGVSFIKTRQQSLWSMNVGCLVDPESFAFAYGKYSKMKPTLGAGLVLKGGTHPVYVPLT